MAFYTENFSPDTVLDNKVKYDAGDPTAGYLGAKVVAGTGITLSEGTGADENKLKITNSLDLSSYVPYSGATTNVNLGAYNLTATSVIETTPTLLKLDQTTPQTIANGQPIFTQGLKITAGQDIRPSADSTTAINIAQADGTDFVTFDTTNKRVGIGTTAPLSKLHIVNNSSSGALSGGGIVVSDVGISSKIEAISGAATFYGVTNGAGSNQFVPIAIGNNQYGPGIYTYKTRAVTTEPTTILQSGDATYQMAGRGADGVNYFPNARIQFEVDGTPNTNVMPGRITFHTNAGGTVTAEVMRIDKSGNVGIGTTAPGSLLTVGSTGAFTVDGSGQVSLRNMAIGNVVGANNGVAALIIRPSGVGINPISFMGYGGSSRLFIQSDTDGGNVGIGTTTPNGKLDIRGTAAPVINIQRDMTGGGGLMYSAASLTLTNTTPTANNGISFYLNAPDSAGNPTITGLFGGRLSTITDGSEVGEIVFATGYHGKNPSNFISTPSMILRATSDTTSDAYFPSGNVGIGTTSPGQALSLKNDNAKIALGAAEDMLLTFTGTQGQIQSDAVTATDSLLLRGGTNGVLFNVGASQYLGITAATSLFANMVTLRTGSATAGTAPLKFTSGALLATPEAGAIEFLTDKYYATITTGAVRKEIALRDTYYGGMYSYENANVTTIEEANVYHAVSASGIVAGSNSGFTWTAGVQGAIASVADYSGTVAGTILITVTAGHNLTSNDYITIHGTTNYNGKYKVTVVSPTTFYVTKAYVSSQTGTYARGARLVANTESAGTYRVSYNISGFTAGNNKNIKLELVKNLTDLDNTASIVKYNSGTDYQNQHGEGMVTITDGDHIYMTVNNKTDGTNYTFYMTNMNIIRI